MGFDIDKKTLIFFVGVIIIAFSITNTFQHQLISVLALFLGVYLAVRGIQ